MRDFGWSLQLFELRLKTNLLRISIYIFISPHLLTCSLTYYSLITCRYLPNIKGTITPITRTLLSLSCKSQTMSTAPDPKFPDLPGLIFGCAPSKHRRSPVKMLLGRYNVKVKGNDKKEDYLLKLVELENSIGEREKEALVNWFAGENTCKALAALLGDALQVRISLGFLCPLF